MGTTGFGRLLPDGFGTKRSFLNNMSNDWFCRKPTVGFQESTVAPVMAARGWKADTPPTATDSSPSSVSSEVASHMRASKAATGHEPLEVAPTVEILELAVVVVDVFKGRERR